MFKNYKKKHRIKGSKLRIILLTKNFNLIANISREEKIVNLITSFSNLFVFYIQQLNKVINQHSLTNRQSRMFLYITIGIKNYKKIRT